MAASFIQSDSEHHQNEKCRFGLHGICTIIVTVHTKPFQTNLLHVILWHRAETQLIMPWVKGNVNVSNVLSLVIMKMLTAITAGKTASLSVFHFLTSTWNNTPPPTPAPVPCILLQRLCYNEACLNIAYGNSLSDYKKKETIWGCGDQSQYLQVTLLCWRFYSEQCNLLKNFNQSVFKKAKESAMRSFIYLHKIFKELTTKYHQWCTLFALL